MSKKILRTTPSLVNNWDSCPTRGFYTDIKQIGQSETKASSQDSREIGILVHKMLEMYYQLLQWTDDKRDVRRISSVEFGRKKSVELSLSSTDVETAIRTFNDYVAFYGDEDIQPLEVEQPFSKVLFETDSHIILMEGKKDLKAVLQGNTWIIDHKTTGSKRFLSPISNQFFAYAWASEVRTVVINSIGTQKTVEPKDRFRRLFVSFTEEQIQEWYGNTVKSILDWIGYIETGHYLMRLTSCQSKFGLCQFHPICSSPPEDRERVIAMDYVHRPPHDPFED